MKAHIRKQRPITCTICGKMFDYCEVELKHRAYTCGFEEDYFECPHCGFEYLGLRTDEESRNWCKERDKIVKQLKAINKTEKEYSTLLAQYLELVEKIKQRSKQLKAN